jgi:hypothetical protein
MRATQVTQTPNREIKLPQLLSSAERFLTWVARIRGP